MAVETAPAPEKGRFVKRMISSHSVLGLAFAALIYVVSLTGAYTVFAHEIALWEMPSAPAADSASPEAYERAIANARAEADPENDIQNMLTYGPSPFQKALTVRLNETDPDGQLVQHNWVADPRTGELVQEIDAPFSHMIEELHVALHLPRPWGRYLVGLLGVCMFTLIISGILAHPSILRDAFKLRLKRNSRIAWTDVHNRLSVWGLPFHAVLTFTGGFLGLAGLIVAAVAMLAYEGDQEAALAALSGPQPVEGRAIEGIPPVASMVREAQERGQPVELIFLAEPQSMGGTTTINLIDPDILDSRTAMIFRNTGEHLEDYGGAEALPGIRALAMVEPLHYGTFGGYPMKVIYFVLALALTWVTSTGMKIWFARRAQQGRAVANTQAAWHGLTTGLSFALALGAILSAAGAALPLSVICLTAWLIVALAIRFAPGERRAVRWAYAATALMLALAAVLHLPAALVSAEPVRPLLLALDASLLLTAIGFAWFAGLRAMLGRSRADARLAPAE